VVAVGSAGVAKWQEKRVFEPWRSEISAAVTRAELMACGRAELDQPNWAYNHGTYTFRCSDNRGVLHEVVPPACNSYEFRHGKDIDDTVNEERVHRFAADCNVVLSSRN
jgi:hypothetical protein